MKKGSLVETLAKRAFYSDAILKSWQGHTQTFGRILEPAFVENYQARIDLTAALNLIGNHEVQKGLQKLQSMQKYISTDEDRAAWLFCVGLGFETANRKEEMLAFYQQAGEYGHTFYLPYLKVANSANKDCVFDVAEENYLKGIECLLKDETLEQRDTILGAAYTNYASTLTMMHRYEEAEETLKKSLKILPEHKGRAAVEAILAAAKGNVEKAHMHLDNLKTQLPDSYESVRDMVDSILENRNPQFDRIAIQDGAIDEFWNWFGSNEGAFFEKFKKNEYDTVALMIQTQLKKVFPFVERDLEVGITPKEEKYLITFADFYMVSLQYGYEELIKAAPEPILQHFEFTVER